MSRVLVLGATGFLGWHVVTALHTVGHDVVPAPGRRDLDLATDGEALAALVRDVRPAAVVNAAGRVVGSPDDVEADNVATARAVAAACRHAPGPLRLVHLGSLAEYGPGSGAPFHEDGVAAPVTSYGRAKLAATWEIVRAGARGDVDPVVLRVANPVGAGQPVTTLAGSVAAQVREHPGEPVRVGPLTAVRDVVSARDVGRAVAAAVAAPRVPVVVNVGSGRGTTMADLVGAILDTARHDAGVVRADGAGSTASAADVAVADVALARAALRWSAADDLAAAVADLVAGADLVAVRT